MILYKVFVVPEPGLMTSIVLPPWRLLYRPGAVTKADTIALSYGYGICCFQYLEDAIRYWKYATRSEPWEVWEVEAFGEVWYPEMPCLLQPMGWGDTTPGICKWTENTVMAGAIRPIRKVYPEDGGEE